MHFLQESGQEVCYLHAPECIQINRQPLSATDAFIYFLISSRKENLPELSAIKKKKKKEMGRQRNKFQSFDMMHTSDSCDIIIDPF